MLTQYTRPEVADLLVDLIGSIERAFLGRDGVVEEIVDEIYVLAYELDPGVADRGEER